MTTYLDRIVAHHRARASRDDRTLADLMSRARDAGPTRPFAGAIRQARGLAVIAEIKRRSPSKGDLNPGLDPAALAHTYEEAGATCLSVLTEGEFFGGSAADLREARSAVALPVLRKDFTVDPRDVCDARLMGADCVLLIAAALDDALLHQCAETARHVGIEALFEVHDEDELDRCVAAGAAMVGVNQRDLASFEVDHGRALHMAGLIPAGVTRVAESGVRGRTDALSLRRAGYDAVLVGEHLVTADDVAAAVRDLRVD